MKIDRFNSIDEKKETVWDAIVIGSGLNGMACALGLALKGRKVLILEKHFIPGGYATSFRRKGFLFEVSLHATSELNKGQNLHRTLAVMGVIDKIHPLPMPETATIKTPKGNFSIGRNLFNELRAAFPAEINGLDRLEKMIEKLLSETDFYMLASAFLPEVILRPFVPTLRKYANITLQQCLEEYLQDDFLIKILSAQWGYMGLPPEKLSSIIYFLDMGSFIKRSIYYIKGTSQSLSNGMIERLEELGGRILLKQEVKKILVENGSAVGVESEDRLGKRHVFKAKTVISNADPYATYNTLLGKQYVTDKVACQLQTLTPSASSTVVYIGLDCQLAEITGENHHGYYFLDSDTDWSKEYQNITSDRLGGVGLTNYSAIDAELSPPGQSAITIMTLDYAENWLGLTEEAYRQKKNARMTAMVAEIEKRFPGFKDHIIYKEMATPLTSLRYTGNRGGAFNGFAYSVERTGMMKGGLDMRTTVKNVYLASAWGGGVSGGYRGSILMGYEKGKLIHKEIKR